MSEEVYEGAIGIDLGAQKQPSAAHGNFANPHR